MRDSSDEEWDVAYAALDPIAQMGWGNRRQEANGVDVDLVRDVFVAADEMHDNAMSTMDGNTQVDSSLYGGADAEEDGESPRTERSVHIVPDMESALEGEHPGALYLLASRPNCRVMHLVFVIVDFSKCRTSSFDHSKPPCNVSRTENEGTLNTRECVVRDNSVSHIGVGMFRLTVDVLRT